MTSATTQHTATTTNPRGFDATSSSSRHASAHGCHSYSDLLSLIAEESYVLTTHTLEAFAAEAFDAFAQNEPGPSYPYGRGFTAGQVLS